MSLLTSTPQRSFPREIARRHAALARRLGARRAHGTGDVDDDISSIAEAEACANPRADRNDINIIVDECGHAKAADEIRRAINAAVPAKGQAPRLSRGNACGDWTLLQCERLDDIEAPTINTVTAGERAAGLCVIESLMSRQRALGYFR